jgi:hypothetical protein
MSRDLAAAAASSSAFLPAPLSLEEVGDHRMCACSAGGGRRTSAFEVLTRAPGAVTWSPGSASRHRRSVRPAGVVGVRGRRLPNPPGGGARLRAPRRGFWTHRRLRWLCVLPAPFLFFLVCSWGIDCFLVLSVVILGRAVAALLAFKEAIYEDPLVKLSD